MLLPVCVEHHLTTNHHTLKDKTTEFFDSKMNSPKHMKHDSTDKK